MSILDPAGTRSAADLGALARRCGRTRPARHPPGRGCRGGDVQPRRHRTVRRGRRGDQRPGRGRRRAVGLGPRPAGGGAGDRSRSRPTRHRRRAAHHLTDGRRRGGPVRRRARVCAGARWNSVLEAAAPYGLAGVSGSSTSVGVVGFCVGGGIGPLSRQFGFGADLVRAVELVTADGVVRRVDAEHEADLFWAVRVARATSVSSPRWSSTWCLWPRSTAAPSSSRAVPPARCSTRSAGGRPPSRTMPAPRSPCSDCPERGAARADPRAVRRPAAVLRERHPG